MAKFRFYTTREYFDELILSIRATKKGDRVLIMSMLFNPIEPTITTLTRELVRAASRGVDVSVGVDAHAFLISPDKKFGPLFLRRALPKRLPLFYAHKLEMLETINTHESGHATILNLPSHAVSLPIAGRSHIKIAIINDQLFIGGCNLQFAGWTDIMIGWKSKETADALYALLREVVVGKRVSTTLAQIDRSIAIDNQSTVMLDSGVRGQSIIFKEAIQMIDAANDWLVITCQYFPNSETAKHLLKAIERGVKVEVIYSHPSNHGFIAGFVQQVSILRERSRLPQILFEKSQIVADPMLHAKLIASDAGMMIGSHNYVRAGVMLGTAEIALKSSDEKLALQAVKTLHRGLRRSKI
jgi:cardiolipin synthase